MIDPKKISILDYSYELAAERIALHPLTERDASRLLIYKNGKISENTYKNLRQYLPENSLLIFNNTKVIKARILFTKPSGGAIEIFLLEPFQADYTSSLSATKKTSWKCMIGGLSKWKENILHLRIKNYVLKIEKKEKLSDAYIIEFDWNGGISFAEVLEFAGDIPLPPYIKRKTEKEDTERYQTIYAKDDGSVAAPTAGLHFTQSVFSSFVKKNIRTEFVTLHVGAGTFKPVKAVTMQDHEMHAEWIDVSAASIKNLPEQLNNPIVAVGTTSLRTLESLYWMGVKASQQPEIKQLTISQWEVYEAPLANCKISAKEALTALLNWMKVNNLQNLFTQSQILIAPGYTFKIAKAIVTNFHQPQSTLLLLVAAAIGDDWKKVYEHALKNDFRFLSYGDGSLLFIENI
jgi:S-adenosylmethionine:tRNA ribosyltransferase-isomerase